MQALLVPVVVRLVLSRIDLLPNCFYRRSRWRRWRIASKRLKCRYHENHGKMTGKDLAKHVQTLQELLGKIITVIK